MSELQQPVEQSNSSKKSHGNRFKIPVKLSVKAMQNSGMSVREVSKVSGMSVGTVFNVWHDPELDDLKPEVVERTKKGMTGLFYKRGLEALLAMKPEKFDNANLSSLAIVSGIMTEKGRLLEGLSTSTLSVANLMQNFDNDRSIIMAKIKALDDETNSKT